jgi:hypothetical protein
MTNRISDIDARMRAAAAGVALDDDAAHNAAVSMTAPLATVDAQAGGLAFEAEPSGFLAAQRRAAR